MATRSEAYPKGAQAHDFAPTKRATETLGLKRRATRFAYPEAEEVEAEAIEADEIEADELSNRGRWDGASKCRGLDRLEWSCFLPQPASWPGTPFARYPHLKIEIWGTRPGQCKVHWS